MWLFYLTIPLMVLAVAIAAVPLLMASRREITQLAPEAEFEWGLHRRRHGRAPQGAPGAVRSHRRPARRATHLEDAAWHQPVLIERH
jgi:hypothetical protein